MRPGPENWRDSLRIRTIVFAAVLALTGAAARADVVTVQDPDKWIEAAMKDIADGKTDDFARNFLKLIDKPNIFDSFSANLKILNQIAPPVFFEKVQDTKYGTALREVIYLALYRQTDYMYFKFTMKNNKAGWLISNFEFKSEPAELFPKGFVAPR
jgi:hypothetical protein